MGHIPVRTCTSCRRADAQHALVRLTVTDGVVVVDAAPGTAPVGRSGRGAYLCPRTDCFETALRRDGAALRRALGRGRHPITVDAAALAAQWRAVTSPGGAGPGLAAPDLAAQATAPAVAAGHGSSRGGAVARPSEHTASRRADERDGRAVRSG